MQVTAYRMGWGALCIVLFSCSIEEKGQDDLHPTLRVGLLRDQSLEEMRNRYEPFFEYTSGETGIPHELIFPETHAELLELFQAGHIDLAYFCGFTFLRLETAGHAVPLVARDVDFRFTSSFLVRRGERAREVAEFQDRPFSFGPRFSTSGYFMPRYFLKEKGIKPEVFFSKVVYSDRHDQIAYWVRDGLVDLGVVKTQMLKQMYRDGRLSQEKVRVLWQTPPYPDNVWTLQASMDESVRIKIQDAFLGLSQQKKRHAQILSNLGAGSFLPVTRADFALLRSIVEEMDRESQAKLER